MKNMYCDRLVAVDGKERKLQSRALLKGGQILTNSDTPKGSKYRKNISMPVLSCSGQIDQSPVKKTGIRAVVYCSVVF